MPVAIVDEPRHPDLDAAIAANPDDVHAYRVYADWLEGHGHPRALLIRAQLAEPDARSPGKAVRKLLHEQRPALLGSLARFEQHLTWRYGFVHSARLPSGNARFELVADLLAHPATRFLATLGIDAASLSAHGPVLARAPATLRELSIATKMACVATDFDDVFARVRTLALHGKLALAAPIVAPAAAHLTLYLEAATADTVRAIASSTLPQVTHLAVVLAGATLAPVVALALPSLVDLRILGAADADAVCELLVAAPFAPQIRRLAIGDSLTTRGVRALVDGRLQLASLVALDVKANAALTTEDLAALRERDGLDVEDGRYDDVDE